MNIALLILTHLSAACLGIGVGFFTHTALCELHRIGDDLDTLAGSTTEEPMKRPNPRSTKRFRGLLLIVGVALALTSPVLALISQQQDQARQQCFNSYANQLADALEPRQVASEELQRQQQRVFAAAGKALESGEVGDLEASLNAYNRAVLTLQRERRANPYPAAPRTVCND